MWVLPGFKKSKGSWPFLRNDSRLCVEMKTFTFSLYFILTITWEMSSISILQVEYLKLREFMQLPKGHRASRWKRQNSVTPTFFPTH